MFNILTSNRLQIATTCFCFLNPFPLTIVLYFYHFKYHSFDCCKKKHPCMTIFFYLSDFKIGRVGNLGPAARKKWQNL